MGCLLTSSVKQTKYSMSLKCLKKKERLENYLSYFCLTVENIQRKGLFTQWDYTTQKEPGKKPGWTSWATYGHCGSWAEKLKSCDDEHGVKTELVEITRRGVNANKYCINSKTGSLTSYDECMLTSSSNGKFKPRFCFFVLPVCF